MTEKSKKTNKPNKPNTETISNTADIPITANKFFSFKQWLIPYTILFLTASLIIWRPFYLAHKSMIWGYDGLYQTYGTMVYFSGYWKEFFSNLFSGNFCLPMVDTSVGTGFDILTTLNYYGFGDPLLWISVLFPRERMEICYNLLTFLRYYLAGLAFGIYGWRTGKRAVSTLGGSFVYIFCGFALYAGVRHPYFMNPWIYFPLLCLGVEQVLEGKKGILLAVTAAVSACSNFYFFYMLTVLTFVYAVIRFWALYRRQWKARFAGVFLSGCGWYLLGIALGAVILLPDIFAVLSSARAGNAAAFANTWFAYPGSFYKQLLAGYLFPVFTADYWCVLVYPAASFLGLLILGNVKKERDHLWLGVWFFILSLLLWIPLGGLAMNGFSYVSHRWFFSYSFCIALLFVLGVEKAEDISVKGLLIYTVFFFGSAWIFFKNDFFNGKNSRKIGAGFCILFFIMIFSILLLRLGNSQRKKRKLQNHGIFNGKTIYSCFMVLCAISSAILSSQSLYSDGGAGYVSEFQDSDTAWQTMTQLSEPAIAKELMASEIVSSSEPEKASGIASASLSPASHDLVSFSRIEGDTPQETNWGMISGINGANSYFSLTRKELYDYAFALENPDLKFPSWYNGFGERASLLSLNCVRYFTRMKDGAMTVPYGYVRKQEFPNLDMEGTGVLYESPYAMPIGYTYDQVLCRQDWETLPALKKQQALMQAAVLNEDAVSQISSISDSGISKADETALNYGEVPLPCTVTATDGIIWNQEDGRLTVMDGGGEIVVRFRENSDSETYLRVCGFDIEGSGYEMLHFFVGADETQEKKIYCTSGVSAWDGKLKNFLVLVNGGTPQEDGSQTARIRFPFAGEFKLENIEMYSLPMEAFVRQAKSRKEESLNTSLSGNQIKGNIHVSGNRILCVSIPYSEGWTAKVDGKKVPLWKCNEIHLGIPLEEGNHEIVLSYKTPGLIPGFFISLLALLFLLVHCHYARSFSKSAVENAQAAPTINCHHMHPPG